MGRGDFNRAGWPLDRVRKMGIRIGVLCLAALLSLPAWAGDWSYLGIRTTLVIDVRTPAEYAAGHVAGAVNIPYDQIAQKIVALPGANKDTAILVYCRSGRRSAIARQALERQGFRRILDGGGMTDLVRGLKSCAAQAC